MRYICPTGGDQSRTNQMHATFEHVVRYLHSQCASRSSVRTQYAGIHIGGVVLVLCCYDAHRFACVAKVHNVRETQKHKNK